MNAPPHTNTPPPPSTATQEEDGDVSLALIQESASLLNVMDFPASHEGPSSPSSSFLPQSVSSFLLLFAFSQCGWRICKWSKCCDTVDHLTTVSSPTRRWTLRQRQTKTFPITEILVNSQAAGEIAFFFFYLLDILALTQQVLSYCSKKIGHSLNSIATICDKSTVFVVCHTYSDWIRQDKIP